MELFIYEFIHGLIPLEADLGSLFVILLPFQSFEVKYCPLTKGGVPLMMKMIIGCLEKSKNPGRSMSRPEAYS